MTVAQRVGKLCEVRYRAPLTPDDLTDFTIAIRTIVKAAREPLVFCTDWRTLASFPKDVVDAIVWIMRRDNPSIASNAILVDADQPAFAAQVKDIVMQGENRARKAFTDAAALEDHLAPMLAAPEQARLKAFLAER